MGIEVKAVTLKALDEDGSGEALFSVWGVADADEDVTERGAFGHGEQEVFLLPHHLWASGAPPLGKGTIWERGDGAVYAFRLNLKLDSAKAWRDHLMFDLSEGTKPRQVWSYGFRVKEGGSSPRPGSRGRRLHALPTGEPGLAVVEVSPVTAASQPLSTTLMAKGVLTQAQQADMRRLKRRLDEQLADRHQQEQAAIRQIFGRWLKREVAFATRR